jgi:hypothetical protein
MGPLGAVMPMVFVMIFKYFWSFKIKLVLTSLKQAEKSIRSMCECSARTGGCSVGITRREAQ